MTKPSSTNQATPPPLNCPYTFFTDVDLGDIIPDALQKLGLNVERHRNHFTGPTKDPVWLKVVGERGWTALTHDKAQGRTRDEIEAIMKSGLANFILIGKNHEQVRDNLVRSIRSVIAWRDKHRPPFIAKLYLPHARALAHAKKSGGTAKGYIKPVLTYSEWLAQRA